MNKRRLSFGLLVTLAATALAIGCGDSTPEAANPPQPSASASAEPAPVASATADPTPPPTAAPTPPPPPPKASKDKWAGKFAQDFSGDVMNAADAAAKKKAGAKDPDNKKYNAAMDKAKAALADSLIENGADSLTWSLKGKAKHTMGVKVVSGDDPSSLKIQFVKDGKKDLKKPIDVAITFSDDDTLSFADPWAKKDPQTLVFKRQK
jgi:hypothetical protein